MSRAKVTLSPKELELVNNSDWILTKNTVIGKVYTLFGQLSESYGAELAKHEALANLGVDLRSAKIAKGEQYEGLPWVMLDHPRHFTTTDTFAIRSFFWWGNHCSITLQLSGIFLERYGAVVQEYFAENEMAGWHVSNNTDAWKHHFREDNYQLIEKDNMELFTQRPFLKIAKKISLTDWDALEGFFEENYKVILQMIVKS